MGAGQQARGAACRQLCSPQSRSRPGQSCLSSPAASAQSPGPLHPRPSQAQRPTDSAPDHCWAHGSSPSRTWFLPGHYPCLLPPSPDTATTPAFLPTACGVRSNVPPLPSPTELPTASTARAPHRPSLWLPSRVPWGTIRLRSETSFPLDTSQGPSQSQHTKETIWGPAPVSLWPNPLPSLFSPRTRAWTPPPVADLPALPTHTLTWDPQ